MASELKTIGRFANNSNSKAGMNWQERKALIRTTFLEFFGENSLMHGAALSYYFMLALVPMLYLSVTYVGMVVGEDSVRQTISLVMTKWVGLDNPETVR